jgi:deoxyribodipyrimidine photo-lyase
LRLLNSDLIIRFGKPEEIIPELARTLRTSWIYCNRERTRDEVFVQDTLEKKLWAIGQEVRYSRGKMLYYTSDLPFPITHTPDNFATFKKEVEKIVRVREPIPYPGNELKNQMKEIDTGTLPEIDFLVRDNVTSNGVNGLRIRGGEDAGLSRLQHFLAREAESKNDKTIFDQHELHFNSLVSPYLSQGCLSPKRLYREIQNFSEKFGRSDIFQNIFQRLMYRDYLRLIAKKYGDKIFMRRGTHGQAPQHWENDPQIFSRWAKGETGISILDAIMHRLQNTGLITHKSRNLTASYLIKELQVDWRMGASWFESQLIDYDPCSNWVNWMNLAGLGPDSKEVRKWNYELQTKRLDPNGIFVSKWSSQ